MVDDTTFVGRRDELRLLDVAWRTQGSSGHVALVSADPGYGKTALIDEFVRRVGAGADVHRASPLQVETETSWSTLRMLTDSWPIDAIPHPVAVAVGRAPADGTPPGLADVAFAWAEAVRSMAAGPTVFVVDDVQWIDRASAAAVATAMRSSTAMWLLGSRADHDSHLDVHRVVDASRLTHVSLAPMRRADIGELVTRHHGGRWSVPMIAWLCETSEGQPLHAIELARELRSAEGGAASPARRPLSAVYGDRLDALSPEARDIGALAALAVHPTVTLLGALRPSIDLDVALHSLERAGLIRVGLDAVDFTHALARRAVTERLGTMERARLHRQLADHVDDPERRALHLGEATSQPDADVAAALEAAARSALARGATFDAARLAERAAALTPGDDVRPALERTALAGVAAVSAGDYERARPLVERVLASEPDLLPEELVFETFMAHSAIVARLEGTAAAARVLPEQLPHVRDASARGELHRTLVRLLQFDDLAAAERAADAAIVDARAHADPPTLLAAEAALANVRFLRGEHVDVDALLERLHEVGDEQVTGQSATAFIQEIVAWDDRHDDARRLCEALAEHGRSAGKITALLNSMSQQANVEMHAGNVAACRKLVEQLLDIIAPPRGAGMFDASEDVIMLAALRGDTAEAERLIREIAAEIDQISPIMRLCFWAGAALAEITGGRYEAALVHLDHAWELAGRIGYADVRSLGWQPDYVEALVHVGRLDRAAEVVAFMVDAAERSRSALVRSESLRSQGLLAHAQGLGAEAVALLEEGVAATRSVSRPLVVGRTHLALGVALRRNGSRSAARTHLHAARQILELLESPPWVARVDRELARLGTRTARTSTLTPTERRIAELVTRGRSNREIATEMIVSLRTVESNLTRAYRKLGVRGRTELAARGTELLADDARGDG
jgi:DNA-binding CsgD family transcriptional regulator